MGCSPRGAGFGIMAVQADSFQVRLELRPRRVHEIICSSKDVKELWGIAGNGGHAGVLLWLWMVYKTFPRVSCTDEIKKNLVWEFWENFCISFLIYPHLRRKGLYIQSAHRTDARRRAVQKFVSSWEWETAEALFPFSSRGAAESCSQVKGHGSEWKPIISISRQEIYSWEREGSRGSYFSSPHPQFFWNKIPHPKVSLLRMCATWTTQRRTNCSMSGLELLAPAEGNPNTATESESSPDTGSMSFKRPRKRAQERKE